MDDSLFTKAAEEAFPEYNVKHMIPVELLDHSGKMIFRGSLLQRPPTMKIRLL